MINNNFVIVVPVYNFITYIKRCLDSILSQDYKNFNVVVLDDQSTDGTWELINAYPVTAYRNMRHDGTCFSFYKEWQKLFVPNEDDIVVIVDGDDYLADNHVISYLNKVYQDNIWLTYGQYMPESKTYKNLCRPIADTKTYRKSGQWTTTHPKTFKRWLYDLIEDKDFRDENGEYLKTAGDRATMYPMIEMAGAEHIKFISKVLYIYNDLNPQNLFRLSPKECIDTAEYIISKPVYKQL